ncbi:MAG: VOC family protein [Acidobacteriota bacterium]
MLAKSKGVGWLLGLIVLLAAPLVSADDEAPKGFEGQAFFFALSVADVEASVAWYQRVLGFEPVREVDVAARGLRIRLLRRPGAYLELIELAGARSAAEIDPEIAKAYEVLGPFKIGFQVESLDRTLQLFEAQKVPLRGSVIAEDDLRLRSTQIVDPDGNVLQIFESLD